MPYIYLTLSCANSKRKDIVNITSKLNGLNLSHEEMESINYFEKYRLLNSNPVFYSTYFLTMSSNIFQIGVVGNIMYYAIRAEFPIRGSSHDHSVLWNLNPSR